jgi:hypothetical protein
MHTTPFRSSPAEIKKGGFLSGCATSRKKRAFKRHAR